MEPIIPRDSDKRKKTKPAKAVALGAPADTLLPVGFLRVIFTLSLITMMGTFFLSAYFLFGFAQTDTGVLTLLSSAALCFGVGAMGYLPSGIMAYWTRRNLDGDWSAGRYWLAILLLLPWIALSLILILRSALPAPYGFLALIITLILMLWPLAGLIGVSKRRKI